jgi:trans-2,3-dihydro-3-hydroxyanthranilate isomerase
LSNEYSFHTLDVFTDTIFGGNPLAVLTDASGLSTEQMQRITREFNLSESVFILPPEDPSHTRRLRIFTPGRELPFAGHPTVGTAYLLAAAGMIPLVEGETHIVLEEGVGPVPVTIRVKNGAPVSTQLTAAQAPEFRTGAPSTQEIAELLSLDVADVATGTLEAELVSCGVPFLLAPLASRDAVRRAKLDRGAWERTLSDAWAREVFLFDTSEIAAAATSGAAIRARMFAPGMGIGEDPATGAAGACLAAYLAKHTRDGAALSWIVEQGFEMGRPSILALSAEKTGQQIGAIRVAGKSVLVSEGKIRVT